MRHLFKQLFLMCLIAAAVCIGLMAPSFADSAPSHGGTIVTTAGTDKSPGYAVDLVRFHSLNLSAIALDHNSRVPFTLGVSLMNKNGQSIGVLKLPQPSPTAGANRFGTWAVYVETRL